MVYTPAAKEAHSAMDEDGAPRYELADVLPGFVVIEKEIHSGRCRAYFSAEPVPPKESYREGAEFWNFAEAAQSFQFSVRDRVSGTIARFDELLGLLYYGCVAPDSSLYRIGELAHAIGISIYVAITYESPKGPPCEIPPEKITILNRAFNDRLRTRGKKILIVPDLFGLNSQVSHGQLMLDFGLTDLPGEATRTPATKEKTG
jgi:hypothetical protein